MIAATVRVRRMRLALGYAAPAILAAMMPVPAAAQAGTVSFGCSAPLTQAGNVQVKQPGPTYRVRGRLQISQLEPVTDPFQSERPSADVKVIGDDSRNVIVLYVLPRPAADGAATAADIVVRTVMPHGRGDERPLGMLSRSEGAGWDELTFDIEAGTERIVVTANGRRQEFAMRIGPNATIEMACLGGVFSFYPVDWGR